MNLTSFNRENTASRVNGEIAVHVSKSGVIVFSAEATKFLQLGLNEKVEFFLDEQAKQWYVGKTANPKAFRCRMDNGICAKFNSAALAKELTLAGSVKELTLAGSVKGKSAKYLISKEPVLTGGISIYPVITRNLLHEKQ